MTTARRCASSRAGSWGKKGPVRRRCRRSAARAHHAFAYVFAESGTFRDASNPQDVLNELTNQRDAAGNRSLVLFDRGDEIVVQAGGQGIRFLLVSGRPIEEPVAWQGPIVMNTQEELRQAFSELRDGSSSGNVESRVVNGRSEQDQAVVKKHSEADDRRLDELLDETFPASDAPANTIATGVRAGGSPTNADVIDNRDLGRFELVVDGETAFLQYERTAKALVLVHTEVPPALRGRHLADLLAKAAIARAHDEGRQVVAVCPFVKAYLRKHPTAGAS
jgi:predicted GNAT family acetyltransferase